MLLKLLNEPGFVHGVLLTLAGLATAISGRKMLLAMMKEPDQQFHFEVKAKGVEALEGGIREGKIKTLMPVYETKTNQELMNEIDFRHERCQEHLDMAKAASAVVGERISTLDKFMRYQQQVEGKPILQQLENRDKVR